MDGVRGLAVLIVFLYHYGGGAQSSNRMIRAAGTVIQAGWCGVTLFFLLSGFLITGILWDGRHRPDWRIQFYWRRTLRIFPLYYATLALVVLAAVWFGDPYASLHHIWTFVLFGQNVPWLPPAWFYLGSPLYATHLWSLAVEEQFYLLWPFLIVRLRTLRQARAVCIAVFAASLLIRLATLALHCDLKAFSVSLPARAGELAAGGYLAMSYRDKPIWSKVERLAPASLALGLAGFVAFAAASHTPAAASPWVYLAGIPSITLAFAGLITLSLRGGAVQRALSAPWLRRLGNISYGVYVFHVLFGGVFHAIARALLPSASRTAELTATALIAAVLTLLLAYLSFYLFESPILRFKNRFAARASPPNAQNPPEDSRRAASNASSLPTET